MRNIDLLVVHCAATRPSLDIGAREINEWHKRRGWSRIGYHYVIRRDGTLETGRPESQIGAHSKGHNANSIGICLVGGVNDKGKAENNFTEFQFNTLERLLSDLKVKYPNADILGHRDLSPDIDGDGVIESWEWVKDCPSFQVRDWWASVNDD